MNDLDCGSSCSHSYIPSHHEISNFLPEFVSMEIIEFHVQENNCKCTYSIKHIDCHFWKGFTSSTCTSNQTHSLRHKNYTQILDWIHVRISCGPYKHAHTGHNFRKGENCPSFISKCLLFIPSSEAMMMNWELKHFATWCHCLVVLSAACNLWHDISSSIRPEIIVNELQA